MTVKVKICGLTELADARHAAECGADCLGFVLHPASPRYIDPPRLRRLVADLPAEVLKVGVFVNLPAVAVLAIMRVAGLDIAQLHGDEDEACIRAIGAARVWKAFALHTPEDVTRAAACPAAMVLVDSMRSGQRGGTGQVADWRLAAPLAALRPTWLAGGLTPENVDAAVAAVRPWGVDVGSGVESEPGRKDHGRLRLFIAAARGTADSGDPLNR